MPTLGIVPYLNMLPLLEGLEEAFPREDWVRATPRELAEMIAAGRVDVAAMSVYEGIRCGKDYRLVPGVGIGSDGAVRSVALYSRVPLPEVRHVLLDHASLTSTHLARILAAELLGIEPVYTLAEQAIGTDYDWRNGRQDALVVIGDTALRWENEFPHRLDLGAGWKELTGMPFVFAAWWARKDAPLTKEHIAAFQAARDRGLGAVGAIVDRVLDEQPDWPGGHADLVSYFSESIRYEVGEREMESLALFRGKLIAHALIPADTPPVKVWGS